MGARLSNADTAWLHMDRPTNLMVINSVELFDEPPDWERVKQIIQSRLVDRYPRFRQRVVESRLPLRSPRWEDDPDFALEHHVHHFALPAPGDRAALQELVGDLMTMPLDRNRPLWHTYLIDGFGDGAAMINRMHHCIADGIALARVMLSLTDSDPDAGIDPPVPDRPRARLRRVAARPRRVGAERVLAAQARPGSPRSGRAPTSSPRRRTPRAWPARSPATARPPPGCC